MESTSRKRIGPLSWLAKRERRFWIGFAMTLPLLYVASVGPVLQQLKRGNSPAGFSTLVIVLYAPLQWLYDHVEFVKAFFDWYNGFFSV